MAAINIYLNFDGNTEEAFNFYKSVFGGEFAMLQRFKETPQGENLPAADQDRIMHVALPIGNGNVLMGSDTSGQHRFMPGNNFHLAYSTDNSDDAHRLFNQLSAGGTVIMPMEKMFWGALFGMLADKFGIQWMVSYDENRSN